MRKILAICIVCAMLTGGVVYGGNVTEKFTEKTLKFHVSKEIVTIGGPIKAEAKKMDMDFKKVATLPIDKRITTADAEDKYPTLITDGAGNLLMAYSTAISFLEVDLGFAYSLDNGENWEVLDPRDPFEGEIELQTALDFCRDEDGKSLAYGTYVTTAGDGGITPFIVFEDMKDPGAWAGYYLDWTDNDFYGLDSIDIACDDEIEGMDEDFVMTYTMSFPAFDQWPEVHQIPFILFHPEGDSYWCYWFYYNWSSHARIDIDRATDTIYLTFQTTNESSQSQDVILEFAPESALGEWGDGRGEIGLFKVEGTADATNPSVDADSNYVYLVCQVNEGGNEDIVCFHSSDGGENWEMAYIANSADNEMYPVIEAKGSTATCLFTKNGNLYTAITEDGGSTWEIKGPVNDEEGSVVEEYACADITAGYAVWTDNRGGNVDIYFDQATAFPAFSIAISGGFGLKITVTNIGTAEATNLQWSVDLEGLVFIGKHSEGSKDSLKPGESITFNVFVLGIGPLTVRISLDGAIMEASGFVVGPFVLGLS